jgi:aldehyde:ferredoxin oxidoreductase
VFLVKGLAGKVLVIDLTTSNITTIRTYEEWVVKFAGGAGYAARILFEFFKGVIPEPLSPDNPLIIMTGPMTGTSAFGSKTVIMARSPLTECLGKSTFAGSFGLELKKAGYDGVVVRGSSEEPVYIVINDDYVDIRSAKDLWGLDTIETSVRIQGVLGKEYKVLTIGEAGEKLVRIATIVSSERRVAGRTGLGAVMGSKRLKAIAVKGSKRVEVYDAETLRGLNSEWLVKALETPRGKGLSEYGTSGGITAFALTGNLPIKHWMGGVFEGAEEISGKTMMEKFRYGVGKRICGEGVLCSITCERVVQFRDSKYGEYVGKGPEYETIAALGSFLLNSNLISIIKANELSDRLGIDTISTGEVIAWAIEAYEKGIITKEDTGGIELRWGDPDLIIKLIELIGTKEGFGEVLAEGVKRASERIGRGSEKFAIHVKGLEVPMHHARLYKSLGLSYATSNRGACHLQGMPMLVERGVLLPEYGINEPPKTVDERVNTVITHQDLCAFADSATLCKFGIFGVISFKHIAKVWNAITGMNFTHEDLLIIGRRVWYLERFLNYMMGLTNRDDTLPERFIKEPLDEGPAKGLICDDFNEMLEKFYTLRGLRSIDELQLKLKELDLNELLVEISRVRLY